MYPKIQKSYAQPFPPLLEPFLLNKFLTQDRTSKIRPPPYSLVPNCPQPEATQYGGTILYPVAHHVIEQSKPPGHPAPYEHEQNRHFANSAALEFD